MSSLSPTPIPTVQQAAAASKSMRLDDGEEEQKEGEEDEEAEATTTIPTHHNQSNALVDRANRMALRASQGVELCKDEIDSIVWSFELLFKSWAAVKRMKDKNYTATTTTTATTVTTTDNPYSYNESNASKTPFFDVDQMKNLLREVCHLSHKDWARTELNAARLAELIFPDESSFDDRAPVMLNRILQGGWWEHARLYAANNIKKKSTTMEDDNPEQLPWAILVTGVNGIRKTSSLYQDWFPNVLSEALVVPSLSSSSNSSKSETVIIDPAFLPSGTNSFFRQLDHIIATICNVEFDTLYSLTGDEIHSLEKNNNHSTNPNRNKKLRLSIDKRTEENDLPAHIVEHYTQLKAAIFSRYRTLCELVGAILLKHVRHRRMNCLMETSGRDIAMFHYVNHFFPDTATNDNTIKYRKLALRFQINTLELAKASVDERMKNEILNGSEACDLRETIYTNSGGPYGSEVLASIQQDSDRVWNNYVLQQEQGGGNKDGGAVVVGPEWFKATIQITAYENQPWTAHAILPDGSAGTVYEFTKR